MLVRDGLGYVHNVPDRAAYGSQEVVYDGLGNPVGLAFLAPLLSALGPALTSALPSIVGAVAPAIGNLFGGGKKDDVPAPAPTPPEAACPPCPACPVCPVCGAQADIMSPMPLMPPMPMPIPMNVAYMHPRPRRRFHARSR